MVNIQSFQYCQLLCRILDKFWHPTYGILCIAMSHVWVDVDLDQLSHILLLNRKVPFVADTVKSPTERQRYFFQQKIPSAKGMPHMISTFAQMPDFCYREACVPCQWLCHVRCMLTEPKEEESCDRFLYTQNCTCCGTVCSSAQLCRSWGGAKFTVLVI